MPTMTMNVTIRDRGRATARDGKRDGSRRCAQRLQRVGPTGFVTLGVEALDAVGLDAEA